ncbi:unnamed protein product [Gongylonema pulchrum]|uniref:VCBS repeat-containing protein n=1 Tax=Gongylonema pulchrum TaxID=637853 RepID=A0A183F0E0_9BILA|nr:unnamed protein product [Gongylonema pulchrum]
MFLLWSARQLLSLWLLHIIVYIGTVNAKLKGRICAYGDIDRDLYTDIIVQDSDRLKIYLQNENGEFSEAGQNINLGSAQIVSCAIGDFNGDSVPDILVSKKKDQVPEQGGFLLQPSGGFFSSGEKGYESTVYMFLYSAYKPFYLNATLLDEVAVMDVNGDGISDVVGFHFNGSLFCQLGSTSGNFSSCERSFK